MNHNFDHIPQSRSWKEIPQHVKSRAMSREGRRRLALATTRIAGIVLATGFVAWGGWEVAAAFRENPKTMPAAARAVPVKHFSLKTDGVLDATWLIRALALPKDAALMELDLQQLRSRLLADGQVSAASLTRSFPDTLAVRLAERTPVVRLRAQRGGIERTLLVARDGVVFEGAGFDAAVLETLPWLDGVRLSRQGGRIQPIAGMEPLAELLARAKLETERLYTTWQVVSLARLESDSEIEVRTKTGTTVVFGAKGDFFPQLAKLDYQWDALANSTVPVAKIDLSLGREVPVTFAPQLTGGVPAATNSGFLNLQPKTKREL